MTSFKNTLGHSSSVNSRCFFGDQKKLPIPAHPTFLLKRISKKTKWQHHVLPHRRWICSWDFFPSKQKKPAASTISKGFWREAGCVSHIYIYIYSKQYTYYHPGVKRILCNFSLFKFRFGDTSIPAKTTSIWVFPKIMVPPNHPF